MVVCGGRSPTVPQAAGTAEWGRGVYSCQPQMLPVQCSVLHVLCSRHSGPAVLGPASVTSQRAELPAGIWGGCARGIPSPSLIVAGPASGSPPPAIASDSASKFPGPGSGRCVGGLRPPRGQEGPRCTAPAAGSCTPRALGLQGAGWGGPGGLAKRMGGVRGDGP